MTTHTHKMRVHSFIINDASTVYGQLICRFTSNRKNYVNTQCPKMWSSNVTADTHEVAQNQTSMLFIILWFTETLSG